MTHLKKVGLILAAVAAMMAFTGASASAAEFHTNTVGATLHGTQTVSHVFKIQGQTVTCKVATFSGETTALTSKEQTMTAKYENCTAFGFVGAKVEMNGCDYVFTAEGGVVHVKNCPNGKTITITGGGCSVDVGLQENVNNQTYVNSADKKTMTVKTASTNVHWNVTSSSFPCPLSTGTGTNGTYSGETAVTAGGATIWWE